MQEVDIPLIISNLPSYEVNDVDCYDLIRDFCINLAHNNELEILECILDKIDPTSTYPDDDIISVSLFNIVCLPNTFSEKGKQIVNKYLDFLNWDLCYSMYLVWLRYFHEEKGLVIPDPIDYYDMLCEGYKR